METYHVTIKKRPNKKEIKQSLFAPTYLYHRSRKAHLSCKCLRFNVPEEDGAFIQLLNKRRCKIFYVILKRQLKYFLNFGKIILSLSSPLLHWIIRLFSFLFFWICRQHMIRARGDCCFCMYLSKKFLSMQGGNLAYICCSRFSILYVHT